MGGLLLSASHLSPSHPGTRNDAKIAATTTAAGIPVAFPVYRMLLQALAHVVHPTPP